MNRLSQKIDNLMQEMANEHHERGWTNFISDGAVNPDIYEQSKPKIVFFLKEAYSKSDDGGWSLTNWLNNGAMTRMWGAVAEWTYGIRNTTTTEFLPKPYLSTEEKTALLKSIAIINVKKSNGTVHSDYADLLQYAELDCVYLKKELDILSPDVIICGNNSSLLRLLYGEKIQDGKVSSTGIIDDEFMHKNGYVFIGKQLIIDYYHPANQYPSMLNYYTVCSLYQQALKRKGQDN